MTATWLGARLQVLPAEVMAQSFSSLGMSCLETCGCVKPGAGSKSCELVCVWGGGGGGESCVEMCKCHLLGWGLCLTGSPGSREGLGWWGREQESDANQPSNPGDPCSWYLQQTLKPFLCVIFISSNVLL